MPYEAYTTCEYYRDAYKGNIIPVNELDKALKQASRHIDSLTYNRIVGRGFSNPDGLPAGNHTGSGLPAGGL